MNKAQRYFLNGLWLVGLVSVALIIYYNLSPSYVDDQGVLVEQFWAIGLASFGLTGSVVGFIALLVWIAISKKTRKEKS